MNSTDVAVTRLADLEPNDGTPHRLRAGLAVTSFGLERPGVRPARNNPRVADAAPMVFLGFGKYVRADRIYALEPIVDERGSGARTRVWVEGIPEPIVASRTERTLLEEMGARAKRAKPGPQAENLF